MPVPKIKRNHLWADRNGDLVWLAMEFLVFVVLITAVINTLLWLLGVSLVAGVCVGRCHMRFLQRKRAVGGDSYSGLYAWALAGFGV